MTNKQYYLHLVVVIFFLVVHIALLRGPLLGLPHRVGSLLTATADARNRTITCRPQDKRYWNAQFCRFICLFEHNHLQATKQALLECPVLQICLFEHNHLQATNKRYSNAQFCRFVCLFVLQCTMQLITNDYKASSSNTITWKERKEAAA